MKTQVKWQATPFEVANAGKSLGILEFQASNDEWHNFDVIELPDRLLFGGACNVGFLESGYILIEDGYTSFETLQELLSELETYYNDGSRYTSRIVCNGRM